MIGIAHDVDAADIDESMRQGESDTGHALRLATEKGLAVAARHPDALVIAADTIVVLDGRIFGKPVDEADACRMLRALSGRTHVVHTAVVVALGGGRRVESRVESTRVTFRELDDSEIAAYVATGEPMDKAGAYAVQGGARRFVERVEGDVDTVIGLPVAAVRARLSSLVDA